MKKKIVWILGLLLFIGVSIESVSAVPKMPCKFSGQVTVNGVDAPIGTVVTAYGLDGVLVGSYTLVHAAGYYGYLFATGDDPDTATDDGAEDGEEITFYVDGNLATASGDTTWSEGQRKPVDLSVGTHDPCYAACFEPNDPVCPEILENCWCDMSQPFYDGELEAPGTCVPTSIPEFPLGLIPAGISLVAYGLMRRRC